MPIAAAVLIAAQGALPLTPLLPSTPEAERREAFAAVAASEDPVYVGPLLDLLALASTREEWFLILDTLTPLVGRDMRSVDRPWRTLSTELSRGTRPGRADDAWTFKGALLAETIDPGFAAFFDGPAPGDLRVDQVAYGGVPVAGIPALVDPVATTAGEAGWLDDDAAVVGLVIGGEARAYPLAIIDWHEMVNDVLGDVPVALTWCTLCGAAIPYRAERGGERLIFGSSGLLHRSNKLMFDEGSRSLWSQLEGRPVSGELTGEPALERLPARVTTWGRWRSDHPRTTVLSRDTGFERTYGEGAAYGDYFAAGATMFAVAHDDSRGAPKEVVVVTRTDEGTLVTSAAEVEAAGGLVIRAGESTLVATSTWKAGPLPPDWVKELGAKPRTLAELERAARAAADRGAPLPPLGLDELAALPRAVRRELIAGASEVVPVLEGARRVAASRQLAADIVVHDAGGRALAWKDGVWVDGEGTRFELIAGELTAKDGTRLERMPSHLAFRFAAPAGNTR